MRRRGKAPFVAVALSVALIVGISPTTAIAHHGTEADCTGTADVCSPSGVSGAIVFGDPGCSWTATISWGDSSPDTVIEEYTGQREVPHTYSAHGTFTVSGTGSGTPTDPEVTSCVFTPFSFTVEVPDPALDWEQLLDRAQAQYELALAEGGTTLGYYHQVLNLLCAAAQSRRPVCAAMIPYYEGVDPNWAGRWIFDVFDRYLNDPKRERDEAQLAKVQALADAGRKLANEICNRVKLKIVENLCDVRRALASSGDEGALVAGALHFLFHLQPNFERSTEAVIRGLPPDSDVETLKGALDSIRKQHKALFENAVEPGFSVVEDSEEISPLGKVVAKKLVPDFATDFREKAIKEALINVHGKKKGTRLYEKTR